MTQNKPVKISLFDLFDQPAAGKGTPVQVRVSRPSYFFKTGFVIRSRAFL